MLQRAVRESGIIPFFLLLRTRVLHDAQPGIYGRQQRFFYVVGKDDAARETTTHTPSDENPKVRWSETRGI